MAAKSGHKKVVMMAGQKVARTVEPMVGSKAVSTADPKVVMKAGRKAAMMALLMVA